MFLSGWGSKGLPVPIFKAPMPEAFATLMRTYAIQFCASFPALEATLFDLPATLSITNQFVRASTVAHRIRMLSGDYRHDPIPGTYQVVFLSNIIHGESPEDNRRLMAKLSHCLEPGGRVIIKDHILDDSLTSPPVGALFSLQMLLTTEKGRCYSFTEVKQWLAAAGLHEISQRRLPPPLTSSLVIAHKLSTPT